MDSSDSWLKHLQIGLENRRLGQSGLPNRFKHQSHEKRKEHILKTLIPPMFPANSQTLNFEEHVEGLSSEYIKRDRNYLNAQNALNW
jgi:hypothetical protein